MMQNFAFGLLNMDMMIILHIKIIRSPIKYKKIKVPSISYYMK